MKKVFNLLFLLACICSLAGAQTPKRPTSGEIYKSIERLNFLGTALYVAAHPDDENTRLISYLANHVNAETYYLSLTRGDGGQNLIGPEIREMLGILRTQELLAARRTDNGKQMFTRANDFGYSKNAEETIEIWDSEKVKQDVVWAIRKVRPDVIINRFDHRTSGSTHGHHTASAMLSHELFEKASDAKVYPNQLQYVQPWKARRLYFNTSWWFFGSEEAFEKADKSRLAIFDVGTYFPILGLSNTEIAALSRSNHKCQGFGSAGTRGEQNEYLELLKGDLPAVKDDIFNGINTTWTRVPNGQPIKVAIEAIIKNFNFAKPQASVPQLIAARRLISQVRDEFWRDKKLNEIDGIISECMGLFLEASAKENYATQGDSVSIAIEVVARNLGGVNLKSITINSSKPIVVSKTLKANEKYASVGSLAVAKEASFTSAYWLLKPGTEGIYNVEDQKLIGLPETPKSYYAEFELEYQGTILKFNRPIQYKYTDPEHGEVYQPFEIIPKASVGIKDNVVVFPDGQPKSITVEVKAFEANMTGKLKLDLPKGWNALPEFAEVILKQKGESKQVIFSVTPPDGQDVVSVKAVFESNGEMYDKDLVGIDYRHVPLQRVLLPNNAKLAKIDIKKNGNRVAYLAGTGDEIPQSLMQIGYKVDEINVGDISLKKLAEYDALIMGIRAYNKHEDLKFKQQTIFEYVKQGGNFIVQYNTNGRDLVLKSSEIMPFPLEISRERVTVEGAPITMLEPNHAVMNTPNKITSEDFDGWVQERGLYFPNKWAPEFSAILSCADPGEKDMNGGLLVAKYGQGNVVYTGYSWFRQLPAGVPGAYRLFANLISLPKEGQKP